jgi:hypothetical protein
MRYTSGEETMSAIRWTSGSVVAKTETLSSFPALALDKCFSKPAVIEGMAALNPSRSIHGALTTKFHRSVSAVSEGTSMARENSLPLSDICRTYAAICRSSGEGFSTNVL